ncbi:MAG: DUF3106 domain-containing protein [Burkholderiaceae bacterium]
MTRHRHRIPALALCAGLAAAGPQSLVLADDVPSPSAGSAQAQPGSPAAPTSSSFGALPSGAPALPSVDGAAAAGGSTASASPDAAGGASPGSAAPSATGPSSVAPYSAAPHSATPSTTGSVTEPMPGSPAAPLRSLTAPPAAAEAPSVPTARGRAVPPPARASLLPLAQPLWSELSRAQQAVLAPFAEQWNSWPTQEKLNWVSLADRVPKMKPAARQKLDQRIREWAQLTPEQRRLARQNYRLAKRLSPDERLAQWERYQQMTPEQQSVLRTSGWTSNTAARHAGARTGLAKEAAQPLAPVPYAAPTSSKSPPPRVQ